MRRVVIRMPPALVGRLDQIDQLRAVLRAQQPVLAWRRALVVRGLLVAGLRSQAPAAVAEPRSGSGQDVDHVQP